MKYGVGYIKFKEHDFLVVVDRSGYYLTITEDSFEVKYTKAFKTFADVEEFCETKKGISAMESLLKQAEWV